MTNKKQWLSYLSATFFQVLIIPFTVPLSDFRVSNWKEAGNYWF